jgi:hypothetical protein
MRWSSIRPDVSSLFIQDDVSPHTRFYYFLCLYTSIKNFSPPALSHTHSNPPALYTHTKKIFIKTLTGRKQAFNFEPENQVLAVKQALQEKEGIQVDQIRLIFSGKQLSDDRSLESYSINAGATIHMVLQLRGGC